MTEVAEKTVVRTSRIGKLPVTIPKGVTVSVTNGAVSVKGAKGTLSWSLPQGTTIAVENEKVPDAGRVSTAWAGVAATRASPRVHAAAMVRRRIPASDGPAPAVRQG